MRIAYVSTDRGVPVFGTKGCSVHVQEMIRAFRRLGHSVTLFTSRVGGTAPADLADVPLVDLPDFAAARPASPADANERTAAAIRREGGFDLVYERYALWSHAGMTAAQAAGRPGLLEVNAPLIDEARRYRPETELAGAEAIAEVAFGTATAVVAVSDDVARYVRGVAGPGHRVSAIPNGVDPHRFRHLRLARARAGFTIGFVGTMKPWHGLAVLVDAFERVAAALPDARLLLVGDGPDREPIAARLADRGLDHRVEWTGAVDPVEIPRLLARMDVAVAPYPEVECYFSPLKVFEYLAAGLPVVASRVGQLSTLLLHERHALLVEPGSAPALAAAIERLAEDRLLRHRIAGGGRVLVESEYTWERIAGRILALGRKGSPSRALTGVAY
ncbi:MAG: glycosyltransferase family 4 protein [Gemmatimonadales bacterium]